MPTLPNRSLTVPQVAEELATSEAQIIAKVRREAAGDQAGGRGQWHRTVQAEGVHRRRLRRYRMRAAGPLLGWSRLRPPERGAPWVSVPGTATPRRTRRWRRRP